MVQPTNSFAEAVLEAIEAEGFDVEDPETPIPPLRLCREGVRCTPKIAEEAWTGEAANGCPYCFEFSIFDRLTDAQIEWECEERFHS